MYRSYRIGTLLYRFTDFPQSGILHKFSLYMIILAGRLLHREETVIWEEERSSKAAMVGGLRANNVLVGFASESTSLLSII